MRGATTCTARRTSRWHLIGIGFLDSWNRYRQLGASEYDHVPNCLGTHDTRDPRARGLHLNDSCRMTTSGCSVSMRCLRIDVTITIERISMTFNRKVIISYYSRVSAANNCSASASIEFPSRRATTLSNVRIRNWMSSFYLSLTYPVILKLGDFGRPEQENATLVLWHEAHETPRTRVAGSLHNLLPATFKGNFVYPTIDVRPNHTPDDVELRSNDHPASWRFLGNLVPSLSKMQDMRSCSRRLLESN